MKKYQTLCVLILLLQSSVTQAQNLVGDKDKGETVFDHHCSVCHSLTANRVGPILSGAYGRKAGVVPAFTYSKAVQSANIIWTDKTLDQWLTNPQQLIPGQRMNSASAIRKNAPTLSPI